MSTTTNKKSDFFWNTEDLQKLASMKPKEAAEHFKMALSSIYGVRKRYKSEISKFTSSESVSSPKRSYTKKSSIRERINKLYSKVEKKNSGKVLNFIINGVNIQLEQAAKNVYIGTNQIKIDM